MTARENDIAKAWLARSEWRDRKLEFGELAHELNRVTMGYAQLAGEGSPVIVSPQLAELWGSLPEHRNILRPILPNRLRYAALDWSWKGFALGGSSEPRLATFGAVLVRLYELLVERLGRNKLGWFLTPLVYLDVGGEPRVAFGQDRRVDEPFAPEMRDAFPHANETAVVFAIGKALERAVAYRGEKSQLEKVIERSTHPDVRKRTPTLYRLAYELHRAGGAPVPRGEHERPAQLFWNRLKAGRGFLSLDLPRSALREFQDALVIDGASVLARELCATTRIRVDNLPREDPDRLWERNRRHELAFSHLAKRGVSEAGSSWSTAAEEGARLERDRDYEAALALYWKATTANDNDVLARFTGIARCCCHRGNYDEALKYADLALVVEPTWGPAFELKCIALLIPAKLGNARFEEALDTATKWCAVAPDDGDAHYVRGKALLRLERYADARDAFDQALHFDPKLVEAMLLRRQVDIAMKNVRTRVGSPAMMQLYVPDDLPELRAAMIGGKLDEALALLSRAELEQHAAAQLYRGQILFFLERYDDALAVLDRSIRAIADQTKLGEARYARARVLTALDRYDDALAELDIIRDAHPEITDAAATRAYVLDALGRPREAEEAELAYLDSARR